MIIKTGIDICRERRFLKSFESGGELFSFRLFSPQEKRRESMDTDEPCPFENWQSAAVHGADHGRLSRGLLPTRRRLWAAAGWVPGAFRITRWGLHMERGKGFAVPESERRCGFHQAGERSLIARLQR